jgi:myxalamid-type polyketide synthase MxaE and MxaD
MRLASDADRSAFKQSGLQPMSSAAALDRLERLLASGARHKIVAAVNWGVLKPVYEARRRRPLLSTVHPLPAATAPNPLASAGGRPSGSVVERLREAPAAQRQEQLIAYLRAQVSAVLGVPATDFAVGRGLFEMGMDSLMSVELKNRLESGLAHPLPSTLTFNYPNVAALAAFLMRELDLDAGEVPAGEGRPVLPSPGTSVRITGDEEAANMTEDELAELLAARLGKITG